MFDVAYTHRNFPQIRPEWLARRRGRAGPGQPTIDPHHHLWDVPGSRYLAAGTAGQTCAAATTCARPCTSSASPATAPTGRKTAARRRDGAMARVCARGADRIRPPLRRHRRLCRHVARRTRPRPSSRRTSRPARGGSAASACAPPGIPTARSRARRTARPAILLAAPGASARASPSWRRSASPATSGCSTPSLPMLPNLAGAFPETPIVLNYVGGPLGIGPYAGKRDGRVRGVGARHPRLGAPSERLREVGRAGDAPHRVWL